MKTNKQAISRMGRGLAVLALVLPLGAHAEDLLQTYKLAQDSDPQL